MLHFGVVKGCAYVVLVCEIIGEGLDLPARMPHTGYMSTADILPLYGRITEFSAWEMCCDERMAVCPDCDGRVCVFCEDSCSSCWTQMW